MNRFLVWMNMLGFALLFGSIALSYLLYARGRREWMRHYLWYAVGHGVWLLFSTYVFFERAFLGGADESLSLAFAYVRALVSLFVVFAGSRLFLTLAGTVQKKGLLVASTAATVTAVGIGVALFVPGAGLVGPLLTATYNLYFGVIALRASLRLRPGHNTRRPRGSRSRGGGARGGAGAAARLMGIMRPFCFYSAGFFLLLPPATFLLPVLLSQADPIAINAMAGGVFTVGWAGLMIAAQLPRLARSTGGHDPRSFAREHGLSERETEILSGLLAGTTSRELGERLFISPRTVETHIANIYQKCEVHTRVELFDLYHRSGESSADDAT